jgi:hypothetical protein
MAYLVRKGTKLIVRKPSGEVVEHACREDTLFHAHERVCEACRRGWLPA